MRMTTNNVDTTAEHVVRVRRMIAYNEAVLARFDPDGLTADGNIEIGEVSAHESSGVFPGRWVAYSLDDRVGRWKLRVYTAEGAARADARMGAGRYAGVVHADMWAISPPGKLTNWGRLFQESRTTLALELDPRSPRRWRELARPDEAPVAQPPEPERRDSG